MGDDKRLIGVLGLLVVVLVWLYFPWPEPVPGAPKYPVLGRVMVNGEAAGGVTVRLYHEDPSLMPQDQVPVGMTDETGFFELSSFGGTDGAAAGTYTATFYWPTNLMQPNKDRFQGKFNNAKQSEFQVTVSPDETMLPPFELEINAQDLLPLEFGLKDLQEAARANMASQ